MTCLPIGTSLLDDLGGDDLPLLPGLVAHVGGCPLDLQDDLVTLLVSAFTEHRVCRRRPGVVPVEIYVVGGVDEELAPAGVGPSGVGHGYGTSHIGVSLDELVLDLVPGSSHTCTGGVPSLDHESLYDPVEDNIVIESLLRQLDEVAGGDGHVVVHVQGDVAHVGVQDYLSHRGVDCNHIE